MHFFLVCHGDCLSASAYCHIPGSHAPCRQPVGVGCTLRMDVLAGSVSSCYWPALLLGMACKGYRILGSDAFLQALPGSSRRALVSHPWLCRTGVYADAKSGMVAFPNPVPVN